VEPADLAASDQRQPNLSGGDLLHLNHAFHPDMKSSVNVRSVMQRCNP
jgi:hypothetical protein